jgi:hypothetical protein
MTEKPPKDKLPDNSGLQSELLEVRQYAIGLAVATERLLETLGHPVESAIITRYERRNLTRTIRKRNI